MNQILRTTKPRKLISDHSYSEGGRTVEVVKEVNPIITAQNIATMAHQACHEPWVVEIAKSIVIDVIDENNNLFLSKYSEAMAVRDWVASKVRYVRDPYRVELVYSPCHLLREIQKNGRASEDCDSFASLVVTLLAAIGHETKVTIAGFQNRPGFSHVFAEVKLPALQPGQRPYGWVVVDPSVGHHVEKMCRDITHSRSFPVGH